ncbi:oxidoreductase C-terminal domain-containing protein [Streptomyces sp. CA-135486]|uniref:oxidoreductase C-terminal domain-containing protein n=1 Tax=Streptomyces sp. CA-135486 TaxID=3240049 RepID=UPI003D93C5EF
MRLPPVCGQRQPPYRTPWFWSGQVDLGLQLAGLALSADRVVVRGNPSYPSRRRGKIHQHDRP